MLSEVYVGKTTNLLPKTTSLICYFFVNLLLRSFIIYHYGCFTRLWKISSTTLTNITFSSSFNEAGETSEWRRSSGERGGARAVLLPPLPSRASECRRCSASSIGTSSSESVLSCAAGGSRGAALRRHTEHRHEFCSQNNYFLYQVHLSVADRRH